MRSGGKKTFKRYLKSEHTDRRTHGHTDGHLDLLKASADALKTRLSFSLMKVKERPNLR